MAHSNRPPKLNLSTEKALHSASSSLPSTSCPSHFSAPYQSASPRPPSSAPFLFSSQPSPHSQNGRPVYPLASRSPSSFSSYTPRPHRASRLAKTLRPMLPMILYVLTSVAFLVAIALYRTELFAFLDELSLWLRADESYGHAVLFFLIFLTTIPPIPLYSTLIVLSGYTFGPWAGAILSYFAALTGALVVFVVSRVLLRECITHWLGAYPSIKRVVRAVEKRPKLLFLIRLAPYPYNVMNCLLAASPTLTLHTYTVCTALSLFKVIIHTSLGASIHSFRDYHVTEPDSTDDEGGADWLARMWTAAGIGLCVVIFVYLSIVARRAVDEELDDDVGSPRDREETVAFLEATSGGETDVEAEAGLSPERMTEVPFRNGLVSSPHRTSFTMQ